MTEEWRPIPGWPYEVSSLGRVRRSKTGRALRPISSAKRRGNRYLQVNLHRWNTQKSFYIHRLVAAAFLEPPRPGQRQVNHFDLDPANNRAENLEWCTQSENERHKLFMRAFDGMPKAGTTCQSRAVAQKEER